MTNVQRIIDGCRQYNKSAQHELYKQYSPYLRGVCMRYTQQTDEAKDILQEGFLKIFSQIKKYNGSGSFEAWMRRIMVNTAIDYYNSKNRKMKPANIDDFENDLPDNSGENPNDNFDAETNSLSLVENADFSEEELLQALTILPNDFKLVFNLHCIEKYKHNEIAKMLKIDERTSRTRLLRARAMLKKHLLQLSIEKLAKQNSL